MSKWTHAICVEDYENLTSNSAQDVDKMKDPEAEICCFCGRTTISGIYIRRDPNEPQFCQHEED